MSFAAKFSLSVALCVTAGVSWAADSSTPAPQPAPVPATVAQTATGETPSNSTCGNRQTPPHCDVKEPEPYSCCANGTHKSEPGQGQCTSRSVINNNMLSWVHFGHDYVPPVAIALGGGCKPCGTAATGLTDLPDGATLPSLQIDRIHRPMDGGGYSLAGFGPGVFSNYDIRLSMWHDMPGRGDVVFFQQPTWETGIQFDRSPSSLDFYSSLPANTMSSLRFYDAGGSQVGTWDTAATAVITSFEGQTWSFDVFGGNARVTRIADRNDNAITITYQRAIADGGGAWQLYPIASVTDAYGRTATFTYAYKPFGWQAITGIDLPNGQHLAYHYDDPASFGLSQVDHPDGSASTFALTYDATTQCQVYHVFDATESGTHRRKDIYLSSTTWTDPVSGAASTQSANRVRLVVWPGAGEVAYLSFPEVDPTAPWKDRNRIYEGGNSLFRFEADHGAASGFLRATSWSLATDPATWTWERVWSYESDGQQRMTAKTDGRGNRTAWTLDATYNRHLADTYPDGSTSAIVWGPLRRELQETDRVGRTTAWTYDAHGNRLSETRAVGTADQATWTWTYNAKGQPLTATDANGHATTYGYDAAGNLSQVVEPADVAGGPQATWTFAYDGAGRRTATTDPRGVTTAFAYDACNRLVDTAFADGSHETTTFGSGFTAGQAVAKTDRNGNQTTFAYDGAGRIATTTWAADTAVAVSETCAYLPGTELKTVCTRANTTTETTYDYANRVQSITTHPTASRSLVATTVYDVLGQPVRRVDAYGRVTAFVYDLNNRLVRAVRELVPGGIPAGADPATLARIATANPPYVITDTTYDAAGQVIVRTDSRGIPSASAYDGQGRLTAQTEAQGTADEATITVAYDAQGNRVQVADARGTVTASTYTGRNLLATSTEAASVGPSVPATAPATASYTYTPTRKVLTVTDALGRVTANTYTVCCDRLKTVTDPLGFVVATYAYDSFGNRLAVTDGNGLTTTTTYDARNRAVATTNAAGETTTMAYADDASGLPAAASLGLGAGGAGSAVTITNALGETTAEIRDGLGRPVRRIDGLGHATTTAYDAVVSDGDTLLVATVTSDPLAHATTALADGGGSVRVTIDALGQRTIAGFDAAGNRTAWRDANGVGQDVVYDARNRATATSDTRTPVATTGTAYDADSNVIRTIDATGQATVLFYDGRNRKLSTTDRVGATTVFGYDAVANLTRITDAEGGVTDYAYDARNLLITEVFPTGQQGRSQRAYAYDGGRRLTGRTVTIAGGGAFSEATTYAYDAANRLQTRGYADGKNDGFTYDAASRLVSASSARYANQVVRTYDAAARLTAETLRFTTGAEIGIDLPVRYVYDADNRLTALTYPDGSVLGKAYTARNELAQVVDGAKPIATRAYDAGGRLVTTQYGNGLTETRTYVPGDTLVAGIAIPGVTGFAYAYDADRRKLSETDSEQASADQRFAYDSQDRLVSWKRGTGTAPTDPATATQTWNLSPVGDWTSTAIDGTTQVRTHTAVHELTAIGGTALAYDAKGNLTRDDQGQTFAWDPENRLAAAGSLQQGQGDSATYAYDALGRRVRKTVTTGAATVPSIFVNAGAQEVVEITGDLTALGDATADPEPAGAAPYNPGTGTGARGSLLADPLAQRFNAQPATTDTPDGWAADTGALAPTSADRGWSTAVAGVDRDHLGRPLYDSFLPLGASTWSIPVANGTHAIVIMCGDADSRQQTNHLLVNGVSVTDPTPYDGNVTLGYETGAFDGYALTVNVTGGLLTISADSGALNPKIDFIEIGATGSTIDADTTARVQAAATQATHDTAKGKAKTPPFVKRSIWGGSYVDDLTSYTVQKPRHAPIRYFAHSNHLYSVAAVTTDGAQLDDISSYVPVVSENQSFALTGVCDVAYGESGHYVFRVAQTGTVTFSNATFGDPMYGTVKRGFVRKAAGLVAEWYSYNAYGQQAIKTPAGAALADSAVGQKKGFTGYRNDAETGIYYARARMHSPNLGRFVSRDPWKKSGVGSGIFEKITYIPLVGDSYPDGVNSYACYFVPNGTDPTGMLGNGGTGCPGDCNGRPFDRWTQGCCSGMIYQRNTQCCVGGQIVRKGQNWQIWGYGSARDCANSLAWPPTDVGVIGGGVGMVYPPIGIGVTVGTGLSFLAALSLCQQPTCRD